MVGRIIWEPGRTFDEFILLPDGETKKDCTIPSISLETRLTDNLVLKIPFLSAAMMSVTGYDLALALGKEGGLPILPAKLTIEEQADIVRRLTHYEMSFVDDPIQTVRETATVEEALQKIKEYGHSKIPVVDRDNVFLGIFSQEHYWETGVPMQENVQKAMLSLESGQVPFCQKPDITSEEAKRYFESNGHRYLVVLNDGRHLRKIAFKKDFEKIKVGVAISTRDKNLTERIRANLNEGVDLFVIDTSDGFNEWQKEVLEQYEGLMAAIMMERKALAETGPVLAQLQSMGTEVPICGGNVVTYNGAMYLLQHGADIIKVGMSSGSFCTTRRQKAVGRAPMTALLDCVKARDDFAIEGGYKRVLMDGGIQTPANMVITLTTADGIMMGSWFNRFLEAAGDKLDENFKPEKDPAKIRYVWGWGEGSERARNLARYGQVSATFFAEGEEGPVEYAGRLKPNVKDACLKIKGAMANAGYKTLEEFRKYAVIELLSPAAQGQVGTAHGIVRPNRH